MSTTKKEFTLALGEFSGHHHTLYGEVNVVEDTDDFKVFVITKETKLTHQEHDTMVFEEDEVIVSTIQKEYDPIAKAVRRVLD